MYKVFLILEYLSYKFRKFEHNFFNCQHTITIADNSHKTREIPDYHSDEQRSTKHTNKTKERVTRTPLINHVIVEKLLVSQGITSRGISPVIVIKT